MVRLRGRRTGAQEGFWLAGGRVAGSGCSCTHQGQGRADCLSLYYNSGQLTPPNSFVPALLPNLALTCCGQFFPKPTTYERPWAPRA